MKKIIVFSAIWKNAGYGTIIYLAAMSSINPELYDAAEADGAGKIRQMWHITLPGIRPTIIILYLLGLSQVLNCVLPVGVRNQLFLATAAGDFCWNCFSV